MHTDPIIPDMNCCPNAIAALVGRPDEVRQASLDAGWARRRSLDGGQQARVLARLGVATENRFGLFYRRRADARGYKKLTLAQFLAQPEIKGRRFLLEVRVRHELHSIAVEDGRVTMDTWGVGPRTQVQLCTEVI